MPHRLKFPQVGTRFSGCPRVAVAGWTMPCTWPPSPRWPTPQRRLGLRRPQGQRRQVPQGGSPLPQSPHRLGYVRPPRRRHRARAPSEPGRANGKGGRHRLQRGRLATRAPALRTSYSRTRPHHMTDDQILAYEPSTDGTIGVWHGRCRLGKSDGRCGWLPVACCSGAIVTPHSLMGQVDHPGRRLHSPRLSQTIRASLRPTRGGKCPTGVGYLLTIDRQYRGPRLPHSDGREVRSQGDKRFLFSFRQDLEQELGASGTC